MNRRRVILASALAVLAVFLGLSVVFALQLGGEPADFRGTALLGDPVPDLRLPSLDGAEVALAERDGRVLVVNFFNSWCIPCKEEEPALREFFAEHGDEADFQMVGIVRDDTEGAVRGWAEARDIGWSLLLDPGGQASVDFGTTGQPETFAVSRDGVIVALQRGRATLEDLERMLALARRS